MKRFNKVANHARAVPRRLVLTSGLAFGLVACSKENNIFDVPTEPPLTQAEVEARSHRIFIITTRRQSENPAEFFTGRRSGSLSFAAVDVVVPPSHKTGQVERPMRLPPDPDKHFVITNPSVYATHNEFQKDYDSAALRRPRGQRSGLLWVHGYNTTLTDAVLRLAQFVEDSGYTGVPFLYSWASQAKLTGYVYDMNSALIARDRLEDIPRLVSQSQLESLDIVAHSMGNFALMEAIRGAAGRGLYDSSGKLRNVILASPDIDVDLFAQQLSRIPPEKRRFFVLTSGDDRALATSRLIARGPRVGQLHPDTLSRLGVNVIDLTQVKDTSSIHHAKFADSPEIVQLLGNRVLAGDSFSNNEGLGLGASFVIGAGGAVVAVDEAI